MRFRSADSYLWGRTIQNALNRRQGQVMQWLEAGYAKRGEPWSQETAVPDYAEWVTNNWTDFTPSYPTDAFQDKYGVERNYAYQKLDLHPRIAVKQAKQRKRDEKGTLQTTWTFVNPNTGQTENLPVEGDLTLSGGWLGPYQITPNNGEFRSVLPIEVVKDGDAVKSTDRGFYDPATNKTYGYTAGGGYRGDFQVLENTRVMTNDLDSWATEEPRLIVGQPFFKRRGQWQKSKLGVGFLLKTKEPLTIESGNWNSRNYINKRTQAGMSQEDAEKIDTIKTPNGYLYFAPMSSNQRMYVKDPTGTLMKKYMAINWPFTTITRALYADDE